MRENRISLAALSEPHSVPKDPGWAISTDGFDFNGLRVAETSIALDWKVTIRKKTTRFDVEFETERLLSIAVKG